MATDDEDFAALFAEHEKKRDITGRKEPRPGELVRGRVVAVGHEAVFVDLGAKSEGMIELGELRDETGTLTVQVGDIIEARVVESGGKAGCIVLRRSLGRGPDARAELEQAFAHGIPVEGMVTGVNKGGVEVQIAGARAFCPISQLDSRHVENPAEFVGQRLAFRITRYEGGPRTNMVLSRRQLLEEEARARAVETRTKLKVGAVMTGTVTGMKDYAAFVDLGGLEGMIHVSELGFARVAHPKDVLTLGQKVEVQVIKIEKTDDAKRSERISLSLKSLEKDPWQDAVLRFPEGTRISGCVVRVEQFGAFVEIAPGIEGLVHISELGQNRNLRHAREVVKVGDTLSVVVLGVDQEKRRLSLSSALARNDDDEDRSLHLETAPRSLGTLADLLKKRQ